MEMPPSESIAAQVRQALAEDLGDGDLTAALVPPQTQVRARVVVREDAILCGSNWFSEVFQQLDPDVSVQWLSLIHISEPTRLDLASRMPSSA